jgi:hypothetical protein
MYKYLQKEWDNEKRNQIKNQRPSRDMHRFTVSYAPPMIQFHHPCDPSHEIKTSWNTNQHRSTDTQIEMTMHHARGNHPMRNITGMGVAITNPPISHALSWHNRTMHAKNETVPLGSCFESCSETDFRGLLPLHIHQTNGEVCEYSWLGSTSSLHKKRCAGVNILSDPLLYLYLYL